MTQAGEHTAQREEHADGEENDGGHVREVVREEALVQVAVGDDRRDRDGGQKDRQSLKMRGRNRRTYEERDANESDH